MKLNEEIPSYELKRKLLNKVNKGYYLITFYEKYASREERNKYFMSFCRFYWSNCDNETLQKVLFVRDYVVYCTNML